MTCAVAAVLLLFLVLMISYGVVAYLVRIAPEFPDDDGESL